MKRYVFTAIVVLSVLCFLNRASAASAESPRLELRETHISAKLSNVASGNSLETTITVQTSLDPEAKQEIDVRLFNNAPK